MTFRSIAPLLSEELGTTESDEDHYTKRVCLFFDILGFSELVKQEKQSVIYGIVNKLKDIPKTFGENNDEQQITAFSDSIVISRTYKDANEIKIMLDLVRTLQVEFLRHGYLTRGGMTVGKMYHNDGIVFGPAFLEAHALESQVAVYPRIALGSELIEEYSKFVPDDLFDDYVRIDFDGIHHVRLFENEALLQRIVNQDINDVCEREITKLAHHISRTLEKKPTHQETQENHTKLRVTSKYNWLENYFDEYKKTVARLKSANATAIDKETDRNSHE